MTDGVKTGDVKDRTPMASAHHRPNPTAVAPENARQTIACVRFEAATRTARRSAVKELTAPTKAEIVASQTSTVSVVNPRLP